MSASGQHREAATVGGRSTPLGQFLDDLPRGLYVIAHVMFLGVGIWSWTRASGSGSPYSAAFALYALSQVGFFGYFANRITMKAAVLAEQSLVFAMVLAIVLAAT